MLRCALLAGFLLAGCGGSRGGGPAWPAPRAADTDTDGGESLAPRQASAVAAIEEAEDATPSPAAAAAPAAPATPAAKPDKPASPETPAAKDDFLTTEEIIIEIDD